MATATEYSTCRRCPVGLIHPTINHALYRCTTRIPLLVEPTVWWSAHLEIIRVRQQCSSWAALDGNLPYGFVWNYVYTTSLKYSLSLIKGAFQSMLGEDFGVVIPEDTHPAP